MAPLLPSESAAYTVTLPEETDNDRLNLKLRTGAALVYTRSSIVVHGGLVIGLGLEGITIPNIREQLDQLSLKDINSLISNEIFYLNIINRKWTRLELPETSSLRPKPRFYHSLAFHRNSIYLFGGLSFDETLDELLPLNDLWEFNIDKKEWLCIDDGSKTGTVARYDHSSHIVDYTSPTDHKTHLALAITGGRGELNQSLAHVALFDLETKTYVDNSEMGLSLNEIPDARSSSTASGVEPKQQLNGEPQKLSVVSETSFVTSGSTNTNSSEYNDDILYILSPKPSDSKELINPLISLPVVPRAPGLRLPLSSTVSKNSAVVPTSLKYPSGGVFGSNIIVSGHNKAAGEFQVYLFNKPSQKWTRLNIDTAKKASDLYLWRSCSWPSHHKVLVLGSAIPPPNASFATVQTFGLIVLVGLPITNIFHAFSIPETSPDKGFAPRVSSLKDNKSFEAYSKYIAPKSQISSIRSVFPDYAVTLGRNAFERYGPSLSDFEFITADGDKINVPLMLLRKRWGRCFDMLLSKAYSRAVYKLETEKDDNDADDIASSISSSKKSFLVLNKATAPTDRDVPEFRLPFQDKSQPTSRPGSVVPSLPTSRKASVVSGNMSMTSHSTNDGSQEDLNLDDLPPQLPIPNEPVPSLEKSFPLKAVVSRDYLRDSPRGSISGISITNSLGSATNHSTVKLQDLRSSVTSSKKKQASRQASVQTTTTDETSLGELKSVVSEVDDETTALLEPLLIPRSLYLPFNTNTVQALSEFMFTGQLGDKWLLTPVTSDNFLIAKFYEIPLLYDLISEALYAIIGKKEDALIKDYGKLLNDYQTQLKQIFRGDEQKIEAFFLEHPNVRESFDEIETYLNTVDDGFLNLALLRKASKVSTIPSSTTSNKGSVDLSKGRTSGTPTGRFGKSSLSKEVNVADPDEDDEVDDLENEPEEEEQARESSYTTTVEPVKFKTDTMSVKSPTKSQSQSDHEEVDPLSKSISRETASNGDVSDQKSITTKASNKDFESIAEDDPLSIRTKRSNIDVENLDDEDPLSNSGPSGKLSDVDEREFERKSKASESKSDSDEYTFQVPEGRFVLPKQQITKVKTHDSHSNSNSNEQKESTSDSDDMGVGLGLVGNLTLKEKKKKAEDGVEENDEEEDDILDPDSNLPTLGNLASPNTPPPGDHVLQVIFEAAALACDMKLLLRSVNVLEMSKFFNNKRSELLKELSAYGLAIEEERLKKEELHRQQEELLRQKERYEELQKSKEVKDPEEAQRTTEVINASTADISAPALLNDSSNSNVPDFADKPSTSGASPVISATGTTNAGPLEDTSNSILSSGQKVNSSDGAARTFSIRAPFSSFRSTSNLKSSNETDKEYRSKTRNPFSLGRKSTSESLEKRSGLFSFIPRRSKTSRDN